MNRDVTRLQFQAAITAGLADESWDPDKPMDDGNPLGMPRPSCTGPSMSPWIGVKREALASHASQVSDAGMMLAMPEEAFAAMFGVEYYREAGRPDGMVPGWFLEQ